MFANSTSKGTIVSFKQRLTRAIYKWWPQLGCQCVLEQRADIAKNVNIVQFLIENQAKKGDVGTQMDTFFKD